MYHTIVVGAGPAGLAAAFSLAALGQRDFLIIERGKPLADRQRACSADVPSGVGGAGLYSDGKFSFFPSATWLWHHLTTQHLQQAYEWLSATLNSYGIAPPPFTTQPLKQASDNVFKAYPSFYMDFKKRYQLTEEWSQQFATNTLTNVTVINISKNNFRYCVTTTAGTYFAKNIVMATGRMGPLQLSGFDMPIRQAFQRIEVGVRIKGPHSHPFFLKLQHHGNFLDPKYILNHPENPRVSWRTFCFCKRGEIMDSGSDGYVTLSGRADCPPTQESNIGFNTRIKLAYPSHVLPKLAMPFCIKLSEVYAHPEILSQYYHPALAEQVATGFFELKKHFNLVDVSELEIAGPTIEGVGEYPIVNSQLETEHAGFYVVGDALGLFRGLTAALLSGHYIGQQIMQSHSVVLTQKIVNL